MSINRYLTTFSVTQDLKEAVVDKAKEIKMRKTSFRAKMSTRWADSVFTSGNNIEIRLIRRYFPKLFLLIKR